MGLEGSHWRNTKQAILKDNTLYCMVLSLLCDDLSDNVSNRPSKYYVKQQTFEPDSSTNTYSSFDPFERPPFRFPRNKIQSSTPTLIAMTDKANTVNEEHCSTNSWKKIFRIGLKLLLRVQFFMIKGPFGTFFGLVFLRGNKKGKTHVLPF